MAHLTLRSAQLAAAPLTLAASMLAAQAPVPPPRIAADPRVELLAIVFRLAGASEYTQNHYAQYDADVVHQFGAFRDHEAVVLARDLHDRRDVTYSTVMRLAIVLGAPPALEPRVPYDSVLGGRVPGAEMQRFVKALRRFVADTRADTFFAAHRAVYDSAAQRIRRLAELAAFRWPGEFFGVGADRDFVVAPLLANSEGNFASCVRPSRGASAGRLECWQIIGHQRTDSAGFAVFDRGLVELLVHEISHTYANPLGNARRAEFERSAPRVHAAFADAMAAQAYERWTSMLNESLVRAAVARFLAAHGTPEEQRTYMADQRALGWLWIDELAARFAEYEGDRRTYPTLEGFMPRVVAYYDSLPDRIPAIERRYDATRPHVVSVSLPTAEGATVDPGLREILVRFDRQVREGRCGPWCRGVVPLFVDGRPTSTQLPPPPVTEHALDSAGTTLRIAVALQRGREYALQLNTPHGYGFRTADGVPLAPYQIRFRTRTE